LSGPSVVSGERVSPVTEAEDWPARPLTTSSSGGPLGRVVVPQPPSKAARAAATARSTSSCVELGAWAISSPVAGL
jgi:hypothetical protein